MLKLIVRTLVELPKTLNKTLKTRKKFIYGYLDIFGPGDEKPREFRFDFSASNVKNNNQNFCKATQNF